MAMIENARPAIIKTIMEDAPIEIQLMNEKILMVQDNEKMATVNLYVSIVFVIARNDFNHSYPGVIKQLPKIIHKFQPECLFYHIPFP